jgi:Type-1V conjugative transfer system mating pair stabilisation
MYFKKLGLIMILATLEVKAARFESTIGKDIVQSISSNIHCMLNKSNNLLEFGKEFDELITSPQGKTSSFSCSFYIKDISDMYSFNLSQIGYKDHALVKVNGNTVWSSNGLDYLNLDYSKTFDETVKDDIKSEDFKFYGINTSSGIVSVETWNWHNNSPIANSLHLLRSGTNTIEVFLAAGRQGGFYSTWQINQKADKEYKCQDGYKSCQSSGEKIVDGVRITKDCWQYKYIKTCDYPSLNDCYKLASCSFISDRECLLHDRYGNCVNVKKEFSCERSETDHYDVETVKFNPTSRNAASKIICANIPCIDGSCVDKTSEVNNEMMDSISKLQGMAKAKDHVSLQVFSGNARHCNKHMAGYHDCCKMGGWGKYLGAKCSKEEKQLSENRKNNKCVYVGKHNSKTLGVTTVTKNYWCCFPSVLEKIIQTQGRKQLGMSFGSSGSPDCRGLYIDELQRLDFNKMDFSDFYADILKRMKLPKLSDLDKRVQNSMPNIKKHSQENADSENRKAGINTNNESLMKENNYGE